MHKGRWIVATLLFGCCLLLSSARVPVASEIIAGAKLNSTAGAKVIAVADEDTAAPNGSLGETKPPGSPSEPPTVTILDKRQMRGILGSAVRSAADEDMGRVVDVIIDRIGSARAAVIDFGGFLGIGSRKIAVDWNTMRFGGDNRITLDMTRDQLKAAPQYQDGKPIVVLGASAELARSQITSQPPEQ